jgi:type IV pilus assembly protein PilA
MRDNKGFTLIELLIVVVIIGILAAIAIPKFSGTREKAYFAALQSDLKNLASQQEIYYSDEYSYSTSATDLGFVSSGGVTVAISTGSTTGWAATAIHSGLAANEGCGIYYGDATAPSLGGADQPGEMGCTQ